jgi:hypothetical protein
MSSEGAPKAKVVDLRRWRQERERRRKTAATEAGLPPPERISWPFRILALISGVGFLAFGAFLSLLVLLVRGERGLPWYSLLSLLLLTLPLGLGIALFGLDLAGRGILGRDWTRASWHRLNGWLDRRARPLPIFLAVSFLLLLPPLWAGRGHPAAWEPVIFWLVGFLHIGLHELGHLLAVRRMGYSPRLLVAGPLTIRWLEGRRFAGATSDWRWLLGGHVWFYAARRTRARDLAVLLGGPLANVLTLAAVLAVDRLLRGTGLFDLYVQANLVCAALVLLANLLPLPRTTEGYATDGRQILELLRGRRIA